MAVHDGTVVGKKQAAYPRISMPVGSMNPRRAQRPPAADLPGKTFRSLEVAANHRDRAPPPGKPAEPPHPPAAAGSVPVPGRQRPAARTTDFYGAAPAQSRRGSALLSKNSNQPPPRGMHFGSRQQCHTPRTSRARDFRQPHDQPAVRLPRRDPPVQHEVVTAVLTRGQAHPAQQPHQRIEPPHAQHHALQDVP